MELFVYMVNHIGMFLYIVDSNNNDAISFGVILMRWKWRKQLCDKIAREQQWKEDRSEREYLFSIKVSFGGEKKCETLPYYYRCQAEHSTWINCNLHLLFMCGSSNEHLQAARTLIHIQ